MAKKPQPVDQVVAANIKRARVHRGYSQIEFAQKVGISCSLLNHYEKGELNVRGEDLWAIAKELDVAIDWFLLKAVV